MSGHSLVLVVVAVLASIGCLIGGVRGQKRQEIFLPADCEVVTVVGNGFKLELSQFELAKANWKASADEARQVDSPRAPPADGDGQSGEARDEQAPVNEHLFDRSKAPGDYGQLNDDLLRWIKARATSLLDRMERYNEERTELAVGNSQRIVLDVLLLNTAVDLDNLAKERIPALRWLRNKLKALLRQQIDRKQVAAEARQYVDWLVWSSRTEESKRVGTNQPGTEWLRNTQAIKRVLAEQRFSEELAQVIKEYLGGQNNLMSRSALYQVFKPERRLDDGLYYPAAGRLGVSHDFPFSAQDAIANGAYV